MTAEEIAQWLRAIGLQQYANIFLNRKIDGKLLESLSDDTLMKELGVTSVLDRKKIITEFRAIGRK